MKSRELLIGILLSVVFFIVFFLLSVPYYSGDVKNHIFWGRSILEEGTAGFYGRDMQGWSYPNYPPVSMLSFAGSVWLYDFKKNSIYYLNSFPFFPSALVPWIEHENVYVSFLKIPAILPFVLSGYFIFLFGRLLKMSRKNSLIWTILFLFNPGLFYLSIVWGQNDFMQVLFILGAFYFLLKEKFVLSYVLAGLSILSKQTVLMVWGIFMISVFKLNGISKSLVAFGTSILVLWIAYLPFNVTGPIWPFTYYNETLKSTGFLVADNAINFWGMYSGFKQLDAAENIFLFSYEKWGFLIFALMFIPLAIRYLKTKFSHELLFYFLFLSSIMYFFILTRMHERYLFFGVVFAQLLVMANRKYWYNLVFFSILYFLNLYRGLFQPDFYLLPELLRSNFFLDGLVIIYLIVLVYNYYGFMFKLNENFISGKHETKNNEKS